MNALPLPRGVWSEQRLHGHLVDIYTPPELHPQGFAAIYLHGVHLGRLIGQTAFEQAADRHGLRIVAPMTGPCFWTDRRCSQFDAKWTPEGFLLGPVLDLVREQLGVAPPGVALFGTSMGGQGALRIGFKHPRKFPVVAGIAPAIDYQNSWDLYPTIAEMYEDREAVRQDTATLHVHPLNPPPHIWFGCDPADERWWESSDRLHMKLSSLGVRHSFDLATSGGGHGFEYYNRMADVVFDFLADGLEQVRRTLPVIPPGAV